MVNVQLRRLSKINLVLLLVVFANISFVRAQPETNIARGKKVAVFPIANYGLTVDRSPAQLTDGNPEHAVIRADNTDAFWVQRGTLGWAGISPVTIVIDLETVQPIAGYSYHTAAGRADVTWPNDIYVAVSDDNKSWRYVGNLAEQCQAPTEPGYREFTFVTRDLKTKGRYIAFGISSFNYIFTNEIEVFRGDDNWLQQEGDEIVFENQPATIHGYMRSLFTLKKIAKRVEDDAKQVANFVNQSSLNTAQKSQLLEKLKLAEKYSYKALPVENYRAIAPMHENHRKVLAVQGELLAKSGYKSLTLWNRHRYAWLPFISKPSKAPLETLRFSMLKNQFRSEALLLTNASKAPKSLKLRLGASPVQTQRNWIKLDAVGWTDTYQGVVVPDVLFPLEKNGEEYSLEIPAGMTCKLWLTVDSSKIPSGRHKNTLVVESAQEKLHVSLQLDISKISMKRPRISLGMWDYTDGVQRGDALGLTPKNKAAALELMRSHYVDTPWGKRPTLPWPTEKDFDSQERLNKELDFSLLDQWIKDWPDARRYFIFLYAPDEFAGAKLGSESFNLRVGSWAQAVSKHLQSKGLQPKQLGLLLVDEPRTPEHNKTVAAWARAIKASASGLTIFQNPHWERPDLIEEQDSITQADILCPVPGRYYGNPEVTKYYQTLRRQGKELWFYQCGGPVRLFDPQGYYRFQAWHTWAVGGTGQGFWSFGDTSFSPTSFNDYLSTYFSFTPAFIDHDTVYNSVHWDSVREGIQDYEELAMLDDAIKASTNSVLRIRAQKVLKDAVASVTQIMKKARQNAGRNTWEAANYAPELADKQLEKIRALLEEFQ